MAEPLPPEPQPVDRRRWLRWAALSGLASFFPAGCSRTPPAPSDDVADGLLRFPGKVPMRGVNQRPPCLETPWRYFREDITPNQAFYVRWHLQGIPTAVDLQTWRLKVGGHVDQPLELSMDDLRKLEPASVVAVNQCSGNSRGLFEPHMPGAQWGNGAMGNARWTGVPLAALLQKAGVKDGAVEVSFAALDRGGLPSVPDFTKSLPLERATAPDVLLAYEMNDEPLPLLNGFPLRLVVPGWYATYWVKALTEVNVLAKPFDGFWVAKAYRIPTAPNAVETPDNLAQKTVPIHRMNVRSFITTPAAGDRLAVGRDAAVDGIAFDGGDGIKQVEVSVDGGKSWQPTELGPDLGKYSFRRWRFAWRPTAAGPHTLQVRATSNSGETQPATAGWNRAGYMRNVIESVDVVVG